MNFIKLTLSLLLLCQLGYAQDISTFKKCKCFISTSKLAEKFPFTDEQQKEVAALKKAYLVKRENLLSQMQQLKKDYNNALKQKPWDEVKINALVKQKMDLVAAETKHYHDMELAMFKLLSEKQKQYWHEIFNTTL